MTRRLLLVACASVCCLQAQLRLYLLQNGSEAPISDQYGFGTVSLGDFRDIPFRLRNIGTGSTQSCPLTMRIARLPAKRCMSCASGVLPTSNSAMRSFSQVD